MRRYTSQDKELIRGYEKTLSTLSYHYKSSFAELWKDYKQIYIHEGKNGLYLYLEKDQSFLLPFSDNLPLALEELKAIASEEAIEANVFHIPSEYLEYFKAEELIRDDSQDEYLYSFEKLTTLSGRHLQSKRNHISQFEKKYEHILMPLSQDDFCECMRVEDQWADGKAEEEKEDVMGERTALQNTFDNWTNYKFSGAVLRAEGKIIAFTIAELLDDEVVIHFEKANSAYHGAYAAINRYYLSAYSQVRETVNRQEDLGIEGLRRAKESYKPIKKIEMYRVKLK